MAERLIAARFHNKSGAPDRERKYINTENALVGTGKWIRRDGRPLDVIEIYHTVTGLQIGTIKMHAKGHVTEKWIWDGE